MYDPKNTQGPECMRARSRTIKLGVGDCPHHMGKESKKGTEMRCTGKKDSCMSLHTFYGGKFAGARGDLDVKASYTYKWLNNVVPGKVLVLPKDGQSAAEANPALTPADWALVDAQFQLWDSGKLCVWV